MLQLVLVSHSPNRVCYRKIYSYMQQGAGKRTVADLNSFWEPSDIYVCSMHMIAKPLQTESGGSAVDAKS